jgi:WD40 repeat protein
VESQFQMPVGRQDLFQQLSPLDRLSTVAISQDGHIVLTGRDSEARFWDAGTGRPIGHSISHPAPVRGALFSANGKTVLTVTDSQARMWDAATGQPLGPPFHPEGTIEQRNRLIFGGQLLHSSRTIVRMTTGRGLETSGMLASLFLCPGEASI